jgi:tRNA threonylcarbamoyladenosine biosynthesis protein TsaE
MDPRTLDLGSADATFELGARLGRALDAGDRIGLIGALGAGKTRLVQGLAHGLGVPPEARVTSPTFTLINEHRGGRLPLHHIDLYRIDKANELTELGIDDLIAGSGIVAIEWCDRFRVLPADHLRLELTVTGEDTRRLVAAAGGPASARLLAAL